MDRRKAFEDVYVAHKDSLLTLAAALVGDRVIAEDVVQDAFAKLLKDGRRLRDDTQLSSYLAVCVRNRAFDLLRRRKHRLTAQGPKALHVPKPNDPAEQAAQNEQEEALLWLVSRLPEDLREVVALRTWGELSFEEIAEAQGTSKSTAHGRYSQALEKLRLGLTRGKRHE